MIQYLRADPALRRPQNSSLDVSRPGSGIRTQGLDNFAAPTLLMFAAFGQRPLEDTLDTPKFAHSFRDLGEPLFDEILHLAAGRGTKQLTFASMVAP